ncbi:hypothetical protein BYZ73_20080 [Rhodovulum viride]|uniref:Secreted protein n=1 Tax=Rhodovulum viride TaxID=1231134 RepID=A0ABX9DD44_9RHOB|nr:VPLPA-CTERM sorting domain-containing protein [Rhodovulum viride]RAP39521.1 hypothetical protein BYZ73_20080 [Rhodovulum viride]
MIRTTLLGALAALSFAAAAQSAVIDLGAKGLELAGGPLAESSALSIIDTAPTDLGFTVIPGFFQALDAGAVPTLELNTGDGTTFNLAVTPGFTVASTETAREGDRQLELLFDEDYFARFTLADGDSLSNILTGATFGDAALSVWALQSTTSAVPLPAGLPLLLAGLGGFAIPRMRKPV